MDEVSRSQEQPGGEVGEVAWTPEQLMLIDANAGMFTGAEFAAALDQAGFDSFEPIGDIPVYYRNLIGLATADGRIVTFGSGSPGSKGRGTSGEAAPVETTEDGLSAFQVRMGSIRIPGIIHEELVGLRFNGPERSGPSLNEDAQAVIRAAAIRVNEQQRSSEQLADGVGATFDVLVRAYLRGQ
jgi:hypothetical protein